MYFNQTTNQTNNEPVTTTVVKIDSFVLEPPNCGYSVTSSNTRYGIYSIFGGFNMQPIPKIKPVRLEGKAYLELRNKIIDREQGRCCVCGRMGEVHHHEPPGRGRKSDTIYTGVYLCTYCHNERHSGKLSEFVKRKINDYLDTLYGEEREKYIIK